MYPSPPVAMLSRAGRVVAFLAAVSGGCSGPRVTPAAGCAQPHLIITNQYRLPIAVAYHLSGPPGHRFLVVYYTGQDGRPEGIDSLPPISQPTQFLGLVQPGRTERLGPIEGLDMGEGPSVRVSVKTYGRGGADPWPGKGPFSPYLACQRD